MEIKKIESNKLFHQKMNNKLGVCLSEIKKSLEENNTGHENSIASELNENEERYRDFEALNHGGMKRILKVRDQATERQLAMAIIRHDATDETIESFLREARITAQLQHPHIVPLYDIGLNAQQEPFFTMKLLDGENLGWILEKLKDGEEEYLKKYPLNQLLSIFKRVCEAVSYAHSKGVIHLDLKPDNIQVSSFGEVLLCDWGLAKILDEECDDPDVERYSLDPLDLKNLTLDGYIKGTPGYMAPEQTGHSQSKRKDKRTDVYALGAILYQILTYEKIIPTDDLTSYIKKALIGDIIAPTELKPDSQIPKALEAVCQKALQVKPDKRYQEAQDILDEIQAYTQGYATKAEDAGFITQFKLLINRHRTITLVSTVSALLLILSTVSFIFSLSQKEARTQEALTKLQKEEKERHSLAVLMAAELYPQALEHFKVYHYATAFQKMATAHKLDPENKKVTELLAQLYFIKASFKEAAPLFKKIDDQQSYLACQKLKNLRALSADEFSDQILSLDNEVLYQNAKVSLPKIFFPKIEDRLIVLKRILEADNIALKNIKAQYSPQGDSIDLSGNPKLQNISALRMMEVQEIKVSHCGITKSRDLFFIHQLKRLDISYNPCKVDAENQEIQLDFLDISYTRTPDFKPFSRANLRHLKVAGIYPLAWSKIIHNPKIKVISLFKGQHFPGIDKLEDKKIIRLEPSKAFRPFMQKGIPKRPGKEPYKVHERAGLIHHMRK